MQGTHSLTHTHTRTHTHTHTHTHNAHKHDNPELLSDLVVQAQANFAVTHPARWRCSSAATSRGPASRNGVLLERMYCRGVSVCSSAGADPLPSVAAA
eukprot:scaffold112731_cov15-Tisochrysis_lutea.AAC.1